MCDKCNNANNSSFLTGAMIGAALGAVFGVLMAPTSGEESRKKLRQVGEKYLGESKVTMEKAQAAVDSALNDIKEKAGPVVKELQDTIEPMVEKVQEASGPLREEIVEKIQQLADEVEEKVEEEKKTIKKRMFSGLK